MGAPRPREIVNGSMGGMASIDHSNLPTYVELIRPTLEAVAQLGGSARAKEITPVVIELIAATEEQLAIEYENRPKSVLIDRIDWARSYAKQAGLLDSPQRGLFLITNLAREVLDLAAEPGDEQIKELDKAVRSARHHKGPGDEAAEPEGDDEDTSWQDDLISRLHSLSNEGFEEFVMYLLRAYGLSLTRTGGGGDGGIDGIGLAPLSEVLSSRVAVQVKRYHPDNAVGREAVALLQRDASAAGAERAVFVTLSRFTEGAQSAAITATPTVDLIDGSRLCELVREKSIGLRIVPQIIPSWFDRFDNVK